MDASEVRRQMLESYLVANNHEKRVIKNDIYTLDEIMMKYFGEAWDDEHQVYL